MLVLASSSPRRMKLLKDRGYTFQTMLAPVSEQLPSGIPIGLGVRYLAEKKAQAGLKHWLEVGGSKEDVVLGADTMVALGEMALGKPLTPADAVVMLKSLSGKEHSVFTGVALVNGLGGMESEVIESKVRFRELTIDEIRTYVETGEPLDKAGAYGIQGGAGVFVDSLEGSLSNVIGLPMEFVSERLKAWGIIQVNIAPREVNHELPETQGFTGGNVPS
ncbi:MAG: Maf family protein [Desulfitobacteriaceae bacterium]